MLVPVGRSVSPLANGSVGKHNIRQIDGTLLPIIRPADRRRARKRKPGGLRVVHGDKRPNYEIETAASEIKARAKYAPPLLTYDVHEKSPCGSPKEKDRKSTSESKELAFNILQQSIETATNMMETDIQNSETLDDIWDMMGSWLGRLKQTKEVAACLRYVEEYFWNIIKTTESLTKPCLQRCTGIVFVLNQILAMFGKLLPTAVPLLEVLRTELYNVIYLRPLDRSLLPQLVCGDDAKNSTLRSPECQSLGSTPSFSLGTSEVGKSAVSALRDKKTFFQSTRMLAQRLSGTKQTADAFSLQRDKETIVLERVISVWQQQLIGRLFCGWRALRTIRLRETQEAERGNNATKRTLLVENALQASRVQERLYQKQILEIERMLSDQEMVATTLANKQSSQIASLKKKLVECEATLDRTRSESTRTVLELEKRAEEVQLMLRKLTEVDFETAQRLKVASIISSDRLTEVQKLSAWIQALVQEHCLYTLMYKFEGFQQGSRLLDTFYLLLSSMSPHHLSPENCANHIQITEPAEKATSLLNACTTLGITTNVEVHELTASSIEEQEQLPQNFQLFVSSLFHRFCNGDGQIIVFQSAKLDEDFSEYNNEETHSIKDWKGRIDRKQALTGKWRNVAHAIEVKSWLGLKKRDDIIGDDRQEFLLFTSIHKDRVSNLFNTVSPNLSATVIAEHLSEVQVIVEKNFKSLRRVYYSYTSKRPDNKKTERRLTSDEFWRQLTDAKISAKTYTRQQIATAFEKANRDSDEFLDPTEWIEALIYISSGMKQGEHLKDKVHVLINDYILVNSKTVLTDEFKKTIYGDVKVSGFLRENKPLLSECFTNYCDRNKRDKRSNASKELDLSEFTSLLFDIPQFESPSTEIIRDIYNKILVELSGSAQGMLLHEFTEAICAVAFYKNPSPFTTTFSKV